RIQTLDELRGESRPFIGRKSERLLEDPGRLAHAFDGSTKRGAIHPWATAGWRQLVAGRRSRRAPITASAPRTKAARGNRAIAGNRADHIIVTKVAMTTTVKAAAIARVAGR